MFKQYIRSLFMLESESSKEKEEYIEKRSFDDSGMLAYPNIKESLQLA